MKTPVPLPYSGRHGGRCFHDYDISRVVTKIGTGGFLVLGSDDHFHVVHQDCVQGKKPEKNLQWK